MTTATKTSTWIADIDFAGIKPMERPAMMVYINAATETDALDQARASADGDVVRGVRLLQPILDRVRAGGHWSISWKAESGAGPVCLTDLDAAPSDEVFGIPFGSDPAWMIMLPWQTVTDARRLAKYLGLRLETS